MKREKGKKCRQMKMKNQWWVTKRIKYFILFVFCFFFLLGMGSSKILLASIRLPTMANMAQGWFKMEHRTHLHINYYFNEARLLY